MVYVFTFLGEFGFELLNWQGVVRKFSRTLTRGDKLVCCSRAAVYPLYETADLFIDISEVERFRKSRAQAYYALPDELVDPNGLRARLFERVVKAELRAFIDRRLQERGMGWEAEPSTYIFSSDGLQLNGCTFGRVGYMHTWAGSLARGLSRRLKAASPTLYRGAAALKPALFNTFKGLDYRSDGAIYRLLDLDNNHFRKIEPDLAVMPRVAQGLGGEPTGPYVLCQTRQRHIPQAAPESLPREAMRLLLEELAGQVQVVLLSFHTGRRLDSFSTFGALPNCVPYACNTFPEQACLIQGAAHCLFFTEGDLGSHVYVPPLMGRDVTVVAPSSVLQLESAPIDFWNRRVFRFGGQITPRNAKNALASAAARSVLVKEIMAKVHCAAQRPS